MELSKARKVADALLSVLSPHCERAMVAGSIRREKPDVKDVELVLIPKTDTTTDLFGDPSETRNLLWEAVHRGIEAEKFTLRWIKPGTVHIVPWHVNSHGKYWRGLIEPLSGAWQMKCDIFLATAENFGAVELIRTGSADFSKEVVTHAQRVGYKFDEGCLKCRGHVIQTPDEETVFERLSLCWVEPSQRIGPQSLRAKVKR